MIKCEYCSRISVEIKSNCDSCGAALPLFQSEAGQFIRIDALPPGANIANHYIQHSGGPINSLYLTKYDWDFNFQV